MTLANHQLFTPQTSDILVVDDLEHNVRFLKQLLEFKDYRVRQALSGEMALQAVSASPPDLILLDICMPDMNGYEVCQKLKANPATADIPVIFLSALTQSADKVKAFEVGGADYVAKPFQVDEVLARIQNQLLTKSALLTLKNWNMQLEAKVRERTQQLEKANQELLAIAYHDSLTRLPNRALLMECLTSSIVSLRFNSNYQFALMFLDCDRFKLINDSFGHTAGDQLLVEIAQRLQSCVRTGDTLARFGGDEFVVLINHVESQPHAEAIAQNFLEALKPGFLINGKEVYIDASIGVVLSNVATYDHPEAMLRDADIAMYTAKNHHRSRVSFFVPQMHQARAQILQVETELRQAITRHELMPYYQPIVNLNQQNVIGVEVLCRWAHPEKGLLTPNVFIPVAEETYLIVELSNWLLEETCAQLHQWQVQRLVDDDFYISFNLSARHLSQVSLPQQIAACLAKYDLKPYHLHLEITESDVLDNAIALDVMRTLQANGIHLSVDDFGTGYSSLSYLYELPVSTVKIDRVFITDITQNAKNASIVSAIINIAKSLNLKVIAEGIEDVHHIDHLRKIDCQLGQGYLFSQPLPAIDIQSLLAENYASPSLASSTATPNHFSSCVVGNIP
ncbi:MAG: putative bifunctional diguanylate cyclase/phosphodiesterase [Leptolyngbyaceae cyanobacterium]